MFKRILSLTVIVCFFLTGLGPFPKAHADSVLDLPAPGTMINLSPAYEPVIIKGLTVHKDNPFLFDFIVDVGQDKMAGKPLKKEGEKLIKYFLASLAIPDKDLWVNLSPYEKNRMVPEALGQTDMGRDLLEQDYILKQITASLIYPEKQLGKTFWENVYAKARVLYGTSQIPVNAFNKVWIMADKAEVFEHNQTVFVVGSHLKVMLEEDYLALTKHQRQPGDMALAVSPSTLPSDSASNVKAPQGNNPTHSIASSIVRQIILPELEKEVNTGRNFANLRQIFNSVILSSWYKKNLKEALLNQVYSNQSKVRGIDLNDPTIKERIYEQYLKAYKKGVFDYIKEDDIRGQTIPRKYFSGGTVLAINPAMITDPLTAETRMANWNNGLEDIQAGVETGSKAMITGSTLTLDQQAIVTALAKEYSKTGSQNIVNLRPNEVSNIADALRGMALLRPSLGTFVDYIDELVARKKIIFQRGSPDFFDALDMHGIDVNAVYYENKIVFNEQLYQDKRALLEAIIFQSGNIIGLAPSTSKILVELTKPGHTHLDEMELKQIKEDMDVLLANKKLLNAANNQIPGIAAGIVLGTILVMQLTGVPIQTKISVAHAFHYIGGLGLGYQQVIRSMHQMLYGEMATRVRDGEEFSNSRVSRYAARAAIVSGIVGQVIAPLAMMHGDFLLGTAATMGFGGLTVWGMQREYARYFQTNTPSLDNIAGNYQGFFKDSAWLPAPSAIALFFSGYYLTYIGQYQMANNAWLVAAAFLIGMFIPDGMKRWLPTANTLAESSRQSKYEGKVTELLRKTVGNKLTNIILYSKPVWYEAFIYWMIFRPRNTGFLQVPLEMLDKLKAHPLPFFVVSAAGAAIAGGLLIRDKVAEKRATKQLLKDSLDTQRRKILNLTPIAVRAQDLTENVINHTLIKYRSPKNRLPDLITVRVAGKGRGLYKEGRDIIFGIDYMPSPRKIALLVQEISNLDDRQRQDLETRLREAYAEHDIEIASLQEVTEETINDFFNLVTIQFRIKVEITGKRGISKKGNDRLLLGTDAEPSPKNIAEFISHHFWLLNEEEKWVLENDLTVAYTVNQIDFSDPAMETVTLKQQKSAPGGIDLNTFNGMQWKDGKDGSGVVMNVDPAMVARIRNEGIKWLSPVIFKMTPIISIWPLAGLPQKD